MDHKISKISTNGTKIIPTGLLVFEILPKIGQKFRGKRSKVFEKSVLDL